MCSNVINDISTITSLANLDNVFDINIKLNGSHVTESEQWNLSPWIGECMQCPAATPFAI